MQEALRNAMTKEDRMERPASASLLDKPRNSDLVGMQKLRQREGFCPSVLLFL